MFDFHKVRIFPNGLDKDGNYTKLVWLKFNSNEEKEAYIASEFKYCKKEENNYLTAFYKEDRIAAKDALLKKRVEFANSQGFSGRGKTWTRAYKVEEGDIA